MKYVKRILILVNIALMMFSVFALLAAFLMVFGNDSAKIAMVIFGGVALGAAYGFVFREQVQRYVRWLLEE